MGTQLQHNWVEKEAEGSMRVSKDDIEPNYIWNYQIKILFSLKMKLFNVLL